jgi:arylsulfatase A-like enzyme
MRSDRYLRRAAFTLSALALVAPVVLSALSACSDGKKRKTPVPASTATPVEEDPDPDPEPDPADPSADPSAEPPTDAPGVSSGYPAPISSAPVPKPHADKPNILVIVAADQRADAISCLPRLRKHLVERGVSFSAHFASAPHRGPSRTSLLTGLSPRHAGVTTNLDLDEGTLPPSATTSAIAFEQAGNEERVVAKWLHQAGYTTGLFGDYLDGYESQFQKQKHVPPHWDEWHAFARSADFDFQLVERGKGIEGTRARCFVSSATKPGRDTKCITGADDVVDDHRENHATDVLKERVLSFIKDAADAQKPFFAYVAPRATRSSSLSPSRYQPDRRKATFSTTAIEKLGACSLFNAKDAPANVFEKDVADKPDWVQALQAADSSHKAQAKVDELRQKQLISALAIEDALDEILAALDASGERDNTVIIYTADAGQSWGEHGYIGKTCAYDECDRTPLIIFDPRHPAGLSRDEKALTADVDLAPTIAALAHAPIADATKLDGADLTPIVFDAKASWPHLQVLTESWAPVDAPDKSDKSRVLRAGPLVALHTPRWLYVELYSDESKKTVRTRKDGSPEIELYDLAKDPLLLDNLVRMPETTRRERGYAQSEIEKVIATMKPSLKKLAAD